MPAYLFTYNHGAQSEWASRHDHVSDDAALHSARCRVGAIDASISVDLLGAGGAKRLATWTATAGVLEMTSGA